MWLTSCAWISRRAGVRLHKARTAKVPRQQPAIAALRLARSAKHPHPSRAVHGDQTPPRPNLVVDPLQVPFHRPFDEAQSLPDLRVAQPITDERKNFDLARR